MLFVRYIICRQALFDATVCKWFRIDQYCKYCYLTVRFAADISVLGQKLIMRSLFASKPAPVQQLSEEFFKPPNSSNSIQIQIQIQIDANSV